MTLREYCFGVVAFRQFPDDFASSRCLAVRDGDCLGGSFQNFPCYHDGVVADVVVRVGLADFKCSHVVSFPGGLAAALGLVVYDNASMISFWV